MSAEEFFPQWRDTAPITNAIYDGYGNVTFEEDDTVLFASNEFKKYFPIWYGMIGMNHERNIVLVGPITCQSCWDKNQADLNPKESECHLQKEICIRLDKWLPKWLDTTLTSNYWQIEKVKYFKTLVHEELKEELDEGSKGLAGGSVRSWIDNNFCNLAYDRGRDSFKPDPRYVMETTDWRQQLAPPPTPICEPLNQFGKAERTQRSTRKISSPYSRT